MIQPEPEDLPKDNPKLEIAVLRLGINPMIQPEPKDLPKDNPKLEIAVLSYGSMYLHTRDGVGMRVKIAASDVREDDEEFEPEASTPKTKRSFFPYMSEVRIDRITEIETTQRWLETSQLVASGERASLVERIGSLRLKYQKVRAMLSIERETGLTVYVWPMALHMMSSVRTMTITRSDMTPEAIEELVNRKHCGKKRWLSLGDPCRQCSRG
ncbi:hypothetical protein Tco_0415483 [Tanacetum coccineum]